MVGGSCCTGLGCAPPGTAQAKTKIARVEAAFVVSGSAPGLAACSRRGFGGRTGAVA